MHFIEYYIKHTNDLKYKPHVTHLNGEYYVILRSTQYVDC
jgi:hypothetical protein